MNNHEKKKIFLEAIDKKLKSLNLNELKKYESLIGTGWRKRILRLIFAPRTVFKLKFNILKNKLVGTEKNINNFEFPFFYFLEQLNSLVELKSIKFLIKNFKSEDIFYDIGAQYGLYTSLALEFCKEVHSFEPFPDFFDFLERNFNKYKNFFLNKLAISDQVGKATITKIGTSIVEEVKKKYKTKEEEIEINTITIDEYIKTHSKPTIVKMDIEGAEFLAIKGGYEFFKNNSPVILMEVLGDEFLNISKKAVKLLAELNYELYEISLDGSLSKISIDFIETLKGVNNLVFIKKSNNGFKKWKFVLLLKTNFIWIMIL